MGAPKIETRTKEESKKLLEILKNSLVFEKVDEEVLSYALSRTDELFFKTGEPIFLEKEASNKIYFVVEGSVEVVKYNEKIKQIFRIKVFNTGDHLSEFSVLTKSNHSTSCFALEDTILLSLNADDFHKLLFKYPKIGEDLVRKLALLNQQVTQQHNYIEYFKPKYFKYHNQFKRYFSLRMIDKLQAIPLSLEEDIVLVATLDPDNVNLYNYLDESFNDYQIKLFSINEEDFKLYREYLQGKYYERSVTLPYAKEVNSSTKTAKNVLELLKMSDLYSKMSKDILQQIAPYFKQVQHQKGDIIFNAGEPSRKFYLIHKGSVELVKKTEDGREHQVVELKANDSFSEISLITGSSHSLIARASENTSIVFLDKNIFDKLLMQPIFNVSLAGILASRLQTLNRRGGVKKKENVEIISNLLFESPIPEAVIRRNKIVPLEIDGQLFSIGLVNPEDEEVYLNIGRYLSNYRVNIINISEAQFASALKALDKFSKEDHKSNSKKIHIDQSDVKEFSIKLIHEAYKNRASDVHLEFSEDQMIVRVRIDGEMREIFDSIPHSFGLQIINFIKIQAGLDIAEKRLPQDGQCQFSFSEKENILARVSIVPAKHGEKTVLRLIKKGGTVRPLNALAPDRKTVSFLKEVTRHRQGLFLVTGPTGSGKTTTLYSILNDMNSVRMNIISVEDPVELEIPGVTQIEVKDDIGLTFEDILRNLLRQDPDIIMIGEIRDKKSAQIAFDAALTGHFVMATLHTNSTLNIIPRLRELGIQDTTIAAGLNGVLAQRLLPAVCPECKFMRETHKTEKTTLRKFISKNEVPEKIVDANGCKKCHESGIYDRIPVFEYWKKTRRIQEAIQEGTNNEELNKIIIKNGFRSLEAYGMDMVVNGLTKIEFVEDYLYGITDSDEEE